MKVGRVFQFSGQLDTALREWETANPKISYFLFRKLKDVLCSRNCPFYINNALFIKILNRICQVHPDCFSEMWSLFNISDTKTLTLYDLENGVTRVTQSEELFDCLPAVKTAFHFAKVFFNNGIDEEEEAEKRAREEEEKQNETGQKNNDVELIKAPIPKVEKTLEFSEFQMFLQSLRQYYLYCQVLMICVWSMRNVFLMLSDTTPV